MKAFRGLDGSIVLFRPDMYMKRFKTSNARLGFPDYCEDELLKLIEELVLIDQPFLGDKPGSALYIRPTSMSMTSTLGVKKPDMVKMYTILSPVQEYFAGKIHLRVCGNFERGGPESSNAFKLGSNYAPTVQITAEYNKRGFSQGLWLHNGYLLESGATNIFFVVKNPVSGNPFIFECSL